MKKIIIILASLFALTVLFSLSSLYYGRKIDREMEGKVSSGPREARQAVPEERKRELHSSDPEKYGMVVIDEFSGPHSQEDWDRLISQKVNNAKARLPQEELMKITDKIKEDPKKTAETIKAIDQTIQKCQEALRDDPGNKELKERLERLRMLKSISRELP